MKLYDAPSGVFALNALHPKVGHVAEATPPCGSGRRAFPQPRLPRHQQRTKRHLAPPTRRTSGACQQDQDGAYDPTVRQAGRPAAPTISMSFARQLPSVFASGLMWMLCASRACVFVCRQVRVDDRVVTKAGAPVVEGVSRVVVDAEEPKYVCRAGLKLEKALAHFGIDVRWARGGGGVGVIGTILGPTRKEGCVCVSAAGSAVVAGQQCTMPAPCSMPRTARSVGPTHLLPALPCTTRMRLCGCRGLVALDSGQSTGGFTDCLLQHGAAKVRRGHGAWGVAPQAVPRLQRGWGWPA